LAWNAAPICRLLPMGLNKLNQSAPMSGPRHEGCCLGMCLPRGSSTTFRSSPHYLFPSPCESYRDHPSWQISNWKRSQCNGELCNSLPYTLTDSCSYLQSRKWSRGGCPCNQGGYSCEHQISKGKEAVRCALRWSPSSLTVWTPRSKGKRNSASEQDSPETQHHDLLVSTGSQDHGGVLRGDRDGKPDKRPANG
jgi:hypothetical protein